MYDTVETSFADFSFVQVNFGVELSFADSLFAQVNFGMDDPNMQRLVLSSLVFLVSAAIRAKMYLNT